MVSYKRFWDTIKNKNISQYDLIKRGIDKRILDSLRHDKNITVYTLEKVCKAIGDCEASDVVSFEDE